MFEAIIDHIAVKVKLACIFRLELALFQVNHDERPQPQMVEEQIDVEVLVADIEAILPADEREALAEFEQEFFQVAHQLRFEFALLERFGQGEEVEDVRVFQGLPSQIGLERGEALGEVGVVAGNGITPMNPPTPKLPWASADAAEAKWLGPSDRG